MATTVLYTVLDGEVIAEKRNGVRSLYVPDPLGSTRALINSSQVQTDTFTYWPYGEVQSRTGTTPTPFQFVGTLGYYKDNPSSSIGRCYIRTRYQDMAKGRWLSKDPIGFRTGDANLYRYTRNSPITMADPTGYDISPRQKACGDKLCRDYYHNSAYHSCSGQEWERCLHMCGGQNNVNFCCSGPNYRCKCLNNPPGSGGPGHGGPGHGGGPRPIIPPPPAPITPPGPIGDPPGGGQCVYACGPGIPATTFLGIPYGCNYVGCILFSGNTSVCPATANIYVPIIGATTGCTGGVFPYLG